MSLRLRAFAGALTRGSEQYIKMGTSSNYGNMFSVLGASAFLPFLPMLPRQALIAYAALAQVVKTWYVRKYGCN